jgi:hypothetical protein
MLLAYVGLTPTSKLADYLRHVVGGFWEEGLFRGLAIGLISLPVLRTWNVPWIHQPVFDKLIKLAVILGSMIGSHFAFVAFHRPGHFITWWKQRAVRRIQRDMEGAWVWKDFKNARLLAYDLLRLAEELWVIEGEHFNRAQQVLALYVLCMTGDGFEGKIALRMAHTAESSGICNSEILDRQSLDELSATFSRLLEASRK